MAETPLAGRKVAFTGRFSSLTHAEFADVVRELGGECVQAPTRSTSYLVIGRDGLPLEGDGRPTQNLQRARQLRAMGSEIELLTEDAFLERVGLVDRPTAVHRSYTIRQLSQFLRVPGRTIRAWMRAGLIQPVEVVHRLAYFDFHEAASAKTLCELSQAGVTTQVLRDSFEQLRHWLPDVERPLSQLAVLENSGRLLVRLESGKLAEATGQLHFDFMAPAVLQDDDEPEKLAEDWIEDAMRCEAAGLLHEAVLAYQQAARLAPHDAILHFDLANLLYSLGDITGAVEHFLTAVDEAPDYAEAWNNLGSVLAEAGQIDEAVDAFRQAIELVPGYADAHYALADVLAQAGRRREAREHWRACLQYDPHGPWAGEIRARLAADAATGDDTPAILRMQ